MADNITLNAGSGGATLATDDDGTAQHQYVKVEWGANNTQTPVSTGASALPIQDGGNSITVDNAGLSELAAAINSSRVDVNIAASGVTQPVSGTITANLGATDNAVLDSIDTNTTTIAGAVSGTEMQVDVVSSALPTGAATAANQSTGNGHLATLAGAVSGTEVQVDVLTSALPSGASTAANQSTANGHLSTLAGAVSGTEMQADIVASLPAGTAVIGDVGISGARTSGGTTIFRSIDVDETEDEVKSSAGQVYWIHAMNLTGSVLYLKLYNAAAASVTVGTTTPVMTLPIATQGDTNGAGFTLSIPNGIAFDTGICVAATTGLADNDTGAPSANAMVVNLGYA